MFKWILIAVGALFLWGGIDNHLNYTSDVNEEPMAVDADQVSALIAGDEKKYVSYTGEPGVEARIFRTYLARPRYAAFGPREEVTLSPAEAGSPQTARDHLGARVEILGPLGGTYAEVQRIKQEGSEETTQSFAYIAPFAGMGRDLWVMSPWFSAAGSEKKSQEWLAHSSFRGRLTRLSDIKQNREDLELEGDLVQQLSRMSGGGISPAAMLLLADRPPMSEADVARTKLFALIADTGGQLFVHGSPAEIEAIGGSRVEGVLKPVSSERYRGFASALGVPELPKRIGILTFETGSSIRSDDRKVTLIGVVGGLIMLSFGVYLLKRSSRQR